MSKRSSWVVGAALVAAVTHVSGDSPLEAQTPMHLFLLAGQSNMAGRGVVADADRVPHPRVQMFDRERRWVPAIDPMHFDKPIAAVGPGRAFGMAVAEADPRVTVGLIPTAVGGSPITTWEPGVRYPETGAFPWDDAVARVRAAWPAGELKAVLWHQGESDGTDPASPLYEARLRSLIARVRTEFRSPALPFLIGQLGRFEGQPWNSGYTTVDTAHRRVAADVPNVAFVSSDGLLDKGDKLHFSAEAARELGRRYAKAYLEMRQPR
jgi:hypothetical protein